MGVVRPNGIESGGEDGGESGLRILFIRQGMTICLFIVSLAILFLHILKPIQSLPQRELSFNATSPPANLHILISATKPDINLCKILLSAAVLGYPTPVIVNWDPTSKDPDLAEDGSHLAKLRGVQQYVTSLDSSHDDDIVLVIDGLDVWMQARPQTLVDRFFDINRRADERIRSELGPAESSGIRQEIVFGSQKRCWPWTEKDPPCYAVPNSTLPADIYGSTTDVPGDDEAGRFLRYRPRFLNSGVSMGTVRAMHKLFGQALEEAQSGNEIGSDQRVFSQIFGDQEIWREAVKQDLANISALSRSVSSSQGLSNRFNAKHVEEVRAKAAARKDGNFEFGIGVDYGSEIGLTTLFAKDDIEWITFSNHEQLQDAQPLPGKDKHRSLLGELSWDITRTLPPLWTFSDERGLNRSTPWSDMPLLTNVWTGTTPAVIHHHANASDFKSSRKTWWPQVWFQKHARTLFDAHIYSPITAVAVSGYDHDSQRQWWPYEIWKGGARNGISGLGSGEGWIKFDDVCRDHHEELFRDGYGPWELPEAH